MSFTHNNPSVYYSRNIVGARKRQEDSNSIGVVDEGNALLFIVADGMGGHEAGDLASNTVVDTFVSAYQNSQTDLNTGYRLTNALHVSNNKIHEIVNKDEQLRGMGCTIVAGRIDKNYLSWVSVGDSVLVLVRGNKVTRLNADHSMKPVLEQSVKIGNLTREQAKAHPDRNSLRSALTGEEVSLIDINQKPFKLRNDDILIFASDGILTLVDNEIGTIARTNKSGGAKQVVDALINEIEDRDKRNQDNTTIQAYLVNGGAGRRSNKFVTLLSVFFLLVLALVGGFFLSKDKQAGLPSSESTGEIDLTDQETELDQGSVSTNIPEDADIQRSKVPQMGPEDVPQKSDKTDDIPITRPDALNHLEDNAQSQSNISEEDAALTEREELEGPEGLLADESTSGENNTLVDGDEDAPPQKMEKETDNSSPLSEGLRALPQKND